MTTTPNRPIASLGRSVGSVLSALVAACSIGAFADHSLGLARSGDVGDTILGSGGLFVCALFAPFATIDVIGSTLVAVGDVRTAARRAYAKAMRPTIVRVVPPGAGPYRAPSQSVPMIVGPRARRLRIVILACGLVVLVGAASVYLGCVR